jgi:hypothetical protein
MDTLNVGVRVAGLGFDMAAPAAGVGLAGKPAKPVPLLKASNEPKMVKAQKRQRSRNVPDE